MGVRIEVNFKENQIEKFTEREIVVRREEVTIKLKSLLIYHLKINMMKY